MPVQKKSWNLLNAPRTYISSSSCRTASTDIPDPLSPLFPIVHHLRQVFRATSRILTLLLYVCSSWSSCFCSAISGVHRSTSLMSSSLLFQQCPTCLVRLTWIVFVMGGRWPYSWYFVGCCRQDSFNIARNECTTWTQPKRLEKNLDGNIYIYMRETERERERERERGGGEKEDPK